MKYQQRTDSPFLPSTFNFDSNKLELQYKLNTLHHFLYCSLHTLQSLITYMIKVM